MAATWSKPLGIGELNNLGPGPYIADDGTTRVVKGGDGKGLVIEVVTLRPGSSKAKRCRVASRAGSRLEGLVGTAANRAGAMTLAWALDSEGDAPDRVWATSAAPGRCFSAPQAVSPKARSGDLEWTVLGAGGTTLVHWSERRPGSDAEKHRYAVGRAGGPFGAARKLAPPGDPFGIAPTFVKDDRVLWTWGTREGAGDDGVMRRWAATSAPRAGAIGKPRQTAATRVGDPAPHPAHSHALTDAAGGQVAVSFQEPGLHFWARRPGRSFGDGRTVTIPDQPRPVDWKSATNAAGDVAAVVVSNGNVYAVVRRRGGTFGSLQHLNPGDVAPEARNPEVALDGEGRAVVVWDAYRPGTSGPSDIHVAVANSAGTFGRAAMISGPELHENRWPLVDANRRGRVAISWTRRIFSGSGIGSSRVYVVRGSIR
jgi:hypothetical protein